MRNLGMEKRVQQCMRYWGYLAGKVVLSGAVSAGLLSVINALWPPPPLIFHLRAPRFGFDLLYTLVVGVWFLISSGLVYLCVWDQRYRCRVCLRRLRMPIETGSWSWMLLLGRPRIEYICPYGHGKLNVSELQISGLENPEWTAHADMWDELCATSKGPEPRP